MRKLVAGVPLDDLSLGAIIDKIKNNERIFQVFVNIHKIVLFHKKKEFDAIRNNPTSLFSVDGRWVQFFANIKGFFPKGRFGGLEVIEQMCALAETKALDVYLLGGEREILKRVVHILNVKFPRAHIVGFRDGFFKDPQEVIKDISQKNPHILFLALPSPTKELLGFTLFSNIESLCYVAGVGGAFDVIAGKTTRAPRWIQMVGMEWLYRCMQDPKRLCKRYFYDGLDFVRIVWKHGI